MKYYEEAVIKGGGSLTIETLSFRILSLTAFISVFGWSELGDGGVLKCAFEDALRVLKKCFAVAFEVKRTGSHHTPPTLQKMLDDLTVESADKVLHAFGALEHFFHVIVEEVMWGGLQIAMSKICIEKCLDKNV